MIKAVKQAIDEGLNDFFWQKEQDSSRTVLGGYTLRVITIRYENGAYRDRKLYQSWNIPYARKVNDDVVAAGFRITGWLPWWREMGGNR